MSRTKKDSRDEKKKRSSVRKKKMKAYVGEKHAGSPKFEPETKNALNPTKLAKEIAKNANRSRKKAARQEGKKEVDDAWDKIWNDALNEDDFDDR